MKRIPTLFLATWITATLLAGCNEVSPPPTQTPNPTPTPVLINITFEHNECIYNGPQPIPPGKEITATVWIKDTDIPGPVPVVGVWALVLNEGATKEDMMEQFVKDLFLGPYESVGAVEVMAGSSKQFSVRTTKGPIYFACYYDPISENSHFIGPIEVEGTNP